VKSDLRFCGVQPLLADVFVQGGAPGDEEEVRQAGRQAGRRRRGAHTTRIRVRPRADDRTSRLDRIFAGKDPAGGAHDRSAKQRRNDVHRRDGT
jgi:hypothetical protein